jgi:hypothetical protein
VTAKEAQLSVFEFLLSKVLGEGLIDVVERDYAFVMRVRILGTWVAIASIDKADIKEVKS